MLLYTTLAFLRDQLDACLRDPRDPSRERHVVLSGLSNLDGTPPSGIENKIVLSLMNIERESAAAHSGPHLKPDGVGFVRMSAPLNLNLYLLVSASNAKYDEALRQLSVVLGYFQGNPVFTPSSAGLTQEAEAFPSGLDKLTMEIVNLDMQGLNNLWGSIGGKYLPSVLYKARMFTLQTGWVREQVPAITDIDTRV